MSNYSWIENPSYSLNRIELEETYWSNWLTTILSRILVCNDKSQRFIQLEIGVIIVRSRLSETYIL